MDCLDDNLIQHIASFVSDPETLIRFGACDRRLRRLVIESKNEGIWQIFLQLQCPSSRLPSLQNFQNKSGEENYFRTREAVLRFAKARLFTDRMEHLALPHSAKSVRDLPDSISLETLQKIELQYEDAAFFFRLSSRAGDLLWEGFASRRGVVPDPSIYSFDLHRDFLNELRQTWVEMDNLLSCTRREGQSLISYQKEKEKLGRLHLEQLRTTVIITGKETGDCKLLISTEGFDHDRAGPGLYGCPPHMKAVPVKSPRCSGDGDEDKDTYVESNEVGHHESVSWFHKPHLDKVLYPSGEYVSVGHECTPSANDGFLGPDSYGGPMICFYNLRTS